ncbi:hypothetical protein F4678DRAFT_452240 [Xylaria arbuscula]|nr:hypothetical protein F4678DRAFT_452240 [Xylaria arbuscula]
MKHANRVIQSLPNEIVVLIAEYMDHKTRTSFMMASKDTYALLKLYEFSISKKCTANFTLPPSGDILSSLGSTRHVLRKNTFPMVAELEIRESWINYFLKNSYPDLMAQFLHWLGRREVETAFSTMETHIKRALYHCDRIADIAANESPIPHEKYQLIKWGVYAQPSSFLSTGGLTKMNPLTNPLARPKQIEYILSLPRPDVIGLFFLIHSVSYAMLMPIPPAELMTIYEECFLRHGTWFMRALFFETRDTDELIRYMITASRVEVHLWECGELQGPAGLKMTLMRRLKELLGGAEGAKFHRKYAKALRELGYMIGNPDEDEDEDEDDESDDDAPMSSGNPNNEG